MKILLAVSGGIDSMYMLERACERALFNYDVETFAVAHCNFALRGNDSEQDEEFVQKCCESKNLPLFSTRFDTAAYAGSHKISIEMAARELRYEWFATLCRNEGFDAVAVAHNADDNAETFFLNLIRGCGTNGLKGMKIDSGEFPHRILRPLLGTSREEIEAYMNAHHLEWREDRTNAEDIYKRNSLRHNVLPVLKSLNPAFLKTLSKDMSNIKAVDDIAEDYYMDNRDKVHDIKSLMSVKHWKYVLYRELSRFGFSDDTWNRLCALLTSGSTVSGKTFSSPEYNLFLTADSIIIDPIRPSDGFHSIKVPAEGVYHIAGRTFDISTVKTPESLMAPDGEIYLPYGKLLFPFYLRQWEEGDFIQPLGMKGTKKLSDMFVDLKIPAHAKSKCIVLAQNPDDKEIRALLCTRINEKMRVTPKNDSHIVIIKEL